MFNPIPCPCGCTKFIMAPVFGCQCSSVDKETADKLMEMQANDSAYRAMISAAPQPPEQSDGKNFWTDISDEANAEADRISRELHSKITPMAKQSEVERLRAFRSAVCGWRENDWPEDFDSGTAEAIASLGRDAEVAQQEKTE